MNKKIIEQLEKIYTKVSTPPVIPDKEAWRKYMDYCLEKIDGEVYDSAGFDYYKDEYAKAKQEFDRL
jgi:hypothetical protein